MRVSRVLFALVVLMALAGMAQGATLIAFHAEWCGPCKTMQPTIDAIERDGFDVINVDIDQAPELVRMYNVTSVPTLVIVEPGVSGHYGREVDRFVGGVSFEKLKERLRPQAKNHDQGKPNPAWRYEDPVGHRAALVRIHCDLTGTQKCKGSGTIVRWGGKLVVLTARHVIDGARSIVVETFAPHKSYKARVVKFDQMWDCAVLAIEGLPANSFAVDVEVGQAAIMTEGFRVESCGFGPDGKLAANSGRFIGYRRSSQNKDSPPDDWFEFSGYARPGDSGGGVFSSSGKLVGVLWGAGDKMVVGVQAGRLHLLLNSAIQQKAYVTGNRQPTPPLPCQPGSNCGPGGCDPVPGPVEVEDAASASGGSMLPWRNATDSKLRQIAEGQARLEAELQAAIRAVQNQAPAAPVPPPIPAPPVVDEPKAKVGTVLDQKLDDFLHKLPIQGPITKLEEKQLESKNGLQRIWGALCAIDGLLIVVVLVVVGVFMLGHKVYQAAHAHKADIDAKLAKTPQIQALFDKLDDFNTSKVEPQLQAMQAKVNDAKAKAEAALHVGTAAAIAAPAGPAAAVVAGTIAAAKPTV